MKSKKVVSAIKINNKFHISTVSKLYTYEQMESDLQQLSDFYPEYLSVDSAGITPDDRNIWVATLGNMSSNKHIFIQSSIHGREYMNTLLTMKSLEYYLDKYDTGRYKEYTYREIFSQLCFHIMPMSNPDGVSISQNGPYAIRNKKLRSIIYECLSSDMENEKTTINEFEYWKLWKANARGVDLNRNFDCGWHAYKGRLRASADHYKGESPESEMETRTIIRVIKKYSTVVAISNHSAGNVIYWDYGSRGRIHELGGQLVKLISEVTGFEAVSSLKSEQDAAGCSDYAVLELGIPAFTIESGRGVCPLEIDEFDKLWIANRDVWAAAACFCINNL